MCVGCASVQLAGTPAAAGARVDRAVARLGLGGRARVSIRNEARPNAHAWKDGRIEVTLGLVRLLDDEELAAAIAHEEGHLEAQHQAGVLAGLDGCRRDLGDEFVADSLGCKVLNDRGLQPQAMVSMLRKVRMSPATDPDCRPLILKRIEHLQRR